MNNKRKFDNLYQVIVITVFTSVIFIACMYAYNHIIFYNLSNEILARKIENCDDTSLEIERQLAAATRDGIDNYSATTETIIGLISEGTSQTIYRDGNNNIRFITQTHLGGGGRSDIEIFFREGKISYIIEKEFYYTAPLVELTFDDIKLRNTEELLLGSSQNICGRYLNGEPNVINNDSRKKLQNLISIIDFSDTDSTYDTSMYTVFSKNYNSAFLEDSGTRFTPSKNEVEKAIAIIYSKISDEEKILDLSEYKVQIIGYLNRNNEKIIHANYFCSDYPEWETNYLMVFDGGNCFFNVKVNLDSGEVFDLYINGSA